MARSQIAGYLLLVLIAAAGAWAAHQVYPKVGFFSAFIVLFAVSWLLFRFSSGERIWKSLSWLKNPPVAALIGFLLAYVYFSFGEVPAGNSLFLSFAAALVAAAVGMWLFKYWNIGG